MDFLSFLWGLKWEFLKQKLLAVWISPNDIQWIDFNNMNDLNRLAEKIVPRLLQSNPNMKNLIKQNAGMFGEEKQREVAEIIDMN